MWIKHSELAVCSFGILMQFKLIWSAEMNRTIKINYEQNIQKKVSFYHNIWNIFSCFHNVSRKW